MDCVACKEKEAILILFYYILLHNFILFYKFSSFRRHLHDWIKTSWIKHFFLIQGKEFPLFLHFSIVEFLIDIGLSLKRPDMVRDSSIEQLFSGLCQPFQILVLHKLFLPSGPQKSILLSWENVLYTNAREKDQFSCLHGKLE